MNQIPGFKRARFAAMKGTFKENEDYCSKQASMTHFGEPFIGKGGRTDRNELYGMLKSGSQDQELMEADFSAYNRFHKGINDYRSLQRPTRVDPFELYLFFGEPGCGKTEFAIQQLGPEYYRLPVSDKLWLTPSCTGKKFMLLDEFRGRASKASLANMLQMFDKYPIECEKKGGFCWWMPSVIIITTNVSPHDWYSYDRRAKEKRALFRRFTGVYRFDRNPEKIPCPVEIDINDHNAFTLVDSEEDEDHYAGIQLHGQGHMMF